MDKCRALGPRRGHLCFDLTLLVQRSRRVLPSVQWMLWAQGGLWGTWMVCVRGAGVAPCRGRRGGREERAALDSAGL